MTRRIRGTTEEVETAALRLRHRLTPAEQLLWQALQRRQLAGLRFRCQHPVGSFILDFYCPQVKLVVEVDGPVHQQEAEHDSARTEILEAHRYTVLRFTNDAVLNELASVLATIVDTATELQARQTASPQTWGAGGAGRDTPPQLGPC